MKWIWLFLLFAFHLSAKSVASAVYLGDTAAFARPLTDPGVFYDSLENKASRNKITRWIYGTMISEPRDTTKEVSLSYEYYNRYTNRIIGKISIKPLQVFGPNFSDTARTTNIWLEKVANKLHSKSGTSVIQKNLWFKEGDKLDPDLMMDNERLIRSLPYLKDVKFVISTRPNDPTIVDILVLTQDVFSFGIAGAVGNIHKGTFGLYDKNVLGAGHEVGTSLVVHTDETPNIGFESYYSINNILGRFINFSTSYANTYQHEEFRFSVQRDFLRPQSLQAGGLTFIRSLRSNSVSPYGNVTSDRTLNYKFVDGWYGRKIDIGLNPGDKRFQATLSGRIRHVYFFDRPIVPNEQEKQFFSNSTMYLCGLSFSERSYQRDKLVYSYGITEDIPKGYLHEIVLGYDQNEFNNRWYSHISLSSGNILKNKPYYLYTALAAGSFFNSAGLTQGMIDFKMNFISQLFTIWNVKARQFIQMNYTKGINRFDPEKLLLIEKGGIRGFGSQIGSGQQRLTINIENVFFQKKSILNFQFAVFSFLDVGIIGPSNKSIFTQDYYAGLGLGLRIRNENLVFKTIQLRLAFYPNNPRDVDPFGFDLDGVSKSRFYSFQPRGPEPLKFE